MPFITPQNNVLLGDNSNCVLKWWRYSQTRLMCAVRTLPLCSS